MTVHPIGEFHPIPNRPGTRGRKLIAPEHGVTSFFVDEFVMDEGASVPLHTHPIEEALVVMEGVVTIQLGDETIVAGAESVIRVPPGVPSRYSQSGARLRAPSAQRLRIVSISSGTPRSSKVLHAQTEPWTRKPAGPEAQLRSPADRALAMLALRPLTAALARFRST